MGSRAFSVCIQLLSAWPARPGRGLAQFDSRAGIKQMSSHREGFGCKSLINEEKFIEITGAALQNPPSFPRPFLSLDLVSLGRVGAAIANP